MVASDIAVAPLLSHAIVRGSAATTLTVNVSQIAPAYGSKYFVTPKVVGAATGAVIFSESGRILGSVDLGGTGALPLSGGAHTILATYSGDTHFAPATTIFPAQVDPVGVRLDARAAGNLASTAVPFIVTITPVFTGEQIEFVQPHGTLTFREGATVLATIPASARATTAVPLSPGTHQLTVDYSGDESHRTASTFASVEVLDLPVSPANASLSVTPNATGFDVDLTVGGVTDPAKLPRIVFTASRGLLAATEFRGNGRFHTTLAVVPTADETIIVSAFVNGSQAQTVRVGEPLPRRRAARH